MIFPFIYFEFGFIRRYNDEAFKANIVKRFFIDRLLYSHAYAFPIRIDS
jgi:hypothetical protein